MDTGPFSDPDVDRRTGDLDGLWRAGLDRRSWVRALAVIAATAWGAAIAAVQLGLSWQFAESVRQTNRSTGDLLYYSFPPSHWFELVLPRLIRELRLGPEDPYWFGQQTWGYEAALYVGTIPLIFAFIGVLGRPPAGPLLCGESWCRSVSRSPRMPRWWPQGYLQLRRFTRIRLFPRARSLYPAHEPRPGHSGRRGIR